MKIKNSMIFIIILLILGGVGYFIYFKGEGLAIAPPSGCNFMIDNDNPSSAYTETLVKNSNFVCDADKCIVQGIVDLSESSTSQKVIIRISDDWTTIVMDYNNNGILESFYGDSYKGSTSGSVGYTYFVEGRGIKYDGIVYGRKRLTVQGTDNHYGTKYLGGNADLSTIPKYDCKGKEICTGEDSYEGTFNFCPAGNPDFPYCSGTSNDIKSESSGSFYTNEYEMQRGNSLNFNPKYNDNTNVENFYIKIKKYDCSCIPAIESGVACSQEQKMCNPSIGECPTGYVKKTSGNIYCSYEYVGFIRGYNTATADNPICYKERYYCRTPSNVYNTHLVCDGSQQIEQSTCGKFGTQVPCPPGQKCFVDDTGELGKGIGGCKCDADACTLGYKEKVGDNTYKECITIGTCTDYSSVKNCPEGLIFDQSVQDCVCDDTSSCNIGESECYSVDNIRKCKAVSYSGTTCYQWETITPCLGELECDDKGTDLLDDSCSCKNVNTCSKGQIQCDGITKYKKCIKDASDVNSCYAFRNSINVPKGQECINNQLSIRSDIGCTFGTAGYECSTDNFERCVDNTCGCLQDQYTATETEYLNPTIKTCIGLNFYNIKKYVGNYQNCYRQEVAGVISEHESCTNDNVICKQTDKTTTETNYFAGKTTCFGDLIYSAEKDQGSVLICYNWKFDKKCEGDEVCKIVGDFASCVDSYSDVGILTAENYAINKEIGVIDIDVTTAIGGNSNIRTVIRILDGDTEVTGTRIDTFTNSEGQININYDFIPTKIGEYIIEVTVDPTGIAYKKTKIINVVQGLDIKLNCPITGIIDRKIICNWKILDSQTGSLVDANPKITVTQGTDDLSYLLEGKTELSFVTSILGLVKVGIETQKEGYISDSETSLVTIQGIKQTIESFKIDNNDITYYDKIGITTGVHQLILDIQESGIKADVQNIESTIRDPSGTIYDLSFMLQNDVWKTSYNFQQPGTTYQLKALIFFEDITLESMSYEYPITTTGSKTESDKGYNFLLYGIIGVIILFILSMIFVLFFIGKRR